MFSAKSSVSALQGVSGHRNWMDDMAFYDIWVIGCGSAAVVSAVTSDLLWPAAEMSSGAAEVWWTPHPQIFVFNVKLVAFRPNRCWHHFYQTSHSWPGNTLQFLKCLYFPSLSCTSVSFGAISDHQICRFASCALQRSSWTPGVTLNFPEIKLSPWWPPEAGGRSSSRSLPRRAFQFISALRFEPSWVISRWRTTLVNYITGCRAAQKVSRAS